MSSAHEAVIRQDAGVVTEIDVRVVRPDDQPGAVDRGRRFVEALAGQPGFVSASLLRSLDGTHVLSYVQWADEGGMATARRAAGGSGPADAGGGPRLYDVVHCNVRDGATVIREGGDLATFVNVITTPPADQAKLVEFVVANDAAFAAHPDYRSANFHRSRDGERVVNYSHWVNEAAFLDAIRGLLKRPDLTMEQANEFATRGAGGIGRTDFRFYEVVRSLHA